MLLNDFVAIVCMCGVGLIFLTLLILDTQRNLKNMYPPTADVNEDYVWILSSEIFIDHVAGGSWARVRQGVYLNPQFAYQEFEKLMKAIDAEPLYNRAALCERERLIK